MLRKLQPKEFQVLVYLIQHRDRVVTKQEFFEALWPNEFVVDTAVARCVAAVRKALTDSPKTPQYIQTWHRQGYRFIATVTEYRELLSTVASLESPTSSAFSEPSVPQTQGWGGERKLVTVLCGAFTNLSALAEQRGVDDLQHMLQTVSPFLQTVVERYGGTVQSLTEDRFVLVFGAAVAQEDHASRAVRAALILQQQWDEGRGEEALPLQVGLGIHTGVGVVQQPPPGARPMWTVLGEPLTVATQLQALATPGTILVSAATANLVQEQVPVEAIGSVFIAGQVGSVTVYRISKRDLSVVQISFPRARFRTRFVGREQELAILHQRLDQVQRGQGQVVRITGDPGIGKSRLLWEFLQRVKAQEVTVLIGCCQSYGPKIPYLPVLDLLRQVCEIREGDHPAILRLKVRVLLQDLGMASAEWAQYLLHLFGELDEPERLQGLSSQAVRARTFEALHQLFLRHSRHQPLLLAVENLHWIDPSSKASLAALVERLIGVSVLLLVTARPGYQSPWMDKSYTTQLALQPLAPHESRRVVQSVLGRTRLATALVQQILAQAQGNPLFLEELTQTTLSQRDSTRVPLVPETIQAVLAAWIDQLPPTEKSLLQMAAVIGPTVPWSLLQPLTALSEEALWG
jgi:class 3 adenylate cyclase